MTAQQREQLAGGGDFDVGLEALADAFVLASRFEYAKSFIADGEDLLPLFKKRRRIF